MFIIATDLLQCVRTGCNKHDRAQIIDHISSVAGLMSVLIQIVAIIAVTGVATSCSALISVSAVERCNRACVFFLPCVDSSRQKPMLGPPTLLTN